MTAIPDNTIATYSKIAERYDALHFTPEFWQREFKVFSRLIPGRHVLDIGCGTGRDAVLFTNHKFDYVGIDGSRNMLRIARRRAPRGKFLLMNFYRLRFPAETFDGFWAGASLLHIPKKKLGSVLRSIRKIVRRGGVGFVSIKEKRTVDEAIITEEKYGNQSRFFAFYGRDEFAKALKQNGFRLIKFHTKKRRSPQSTDWLCYFVRRIS
ncbi:methyltransferase domain-containing protein [Candidatus Parcubacteria bacterium]|nr:methyltransferase domain-containing protein [Candidatus Parcubacteria bacterium]